MHNLNKAVLKQLGWQTMWEAYTGVMFARANQWSLDLAKTWLRSARDNEVHCRNYKNRWPTEQNCLIYLLRAIEFAPDSENRIYSARAQEFNTPWGEFISHLWGGIGGGHSTHENAIITDAVQRPVKDIRREDRIEELWRIHGVWSRKMRRAYIHRALNNTRDFIC